MKKHNSYKGFNNMYHILKRNQYKIKSSKRIPSHIGMCGKKNYLSYKEVCYWFNQFKVNHGYTKKRTYW